MDGLGLCHNDEVQISLSDWMDGLGLCHNDEVQKYHYQIEWNGLGLCHNDEVQISLSDWMDGLGLCHNDEVQISLSDWKFRSLPKYKYHYQIEWMV